MARSILAAVAACLLLTANAAASPERVRFLEGAAAAAKLSPEQLVQPVEGYLSAEERAAIASSLPPPPAAGSQAAKAEDEQFGWLHRAANGKRWQVAVEDDLSVYPRFTEQLGFRLERAKAPALVTLLNRIAGDALAISAEAKARHPRLRPFQASALQRVCGHAVPPRPDPAAKGTGYPSGHAAAGWSAALVLVEAVPAGAQAIIGRAVAFGQSRVVCGLHYPADVDAGQYIGSAVIARAFEKPGFRQDLACARREVEALMRGEAVADLPSCTVSP
jgi:acid phosphatase (class A)